MQNFIPGQIATITKSEIPTGAAVGYQIQKAATGAVVLARTTNGVIERPPGSGNYVINFEAPIEAETYLLIWDWNSGAIDPLTSEVDTIQVVPQTGMGAGSLASIADYVKMHMGGDTYKLIAESVKFGTPEIARAIEVVKHRTMSSPPATQDEQYLPVLVRDYLGILGALELVQAARDAWGQVAYSLSKGNSPTEIVTYANRAELVADLQKSLLERLRNAQGAALPLINAPVVIPSNGPLIDEEIEGARVTRDPRQFPTQNDFPFRDRIGEWSL